jgi:hypothetical protein
MLARRGVPADGSLLPSERLLHHHGILGVRASEHLASQLDDLPAEPLPPAAARGML